MYSYEIEQFLRERDHIITPEECMMIMNPNQSCQIRSVKYYASDNEYQVETSDGYYFMFQVRRKGEK